MPPRLSSRDGNVRTFAYRGASAQVEPDSAEAFTLALRLGAGGLATGVRLTADGVPVVSHDARIGGRLRRRPIGRVPRAQLPDSVVDLEQLLDLAGPDVWLALNLADPASLGPVLAAARRADAGAEARLLLASSDLDQLARWRGETTAQLVLTTRQRQIKLKPEQLAAGLQRAEVDAMGLPHDDWSPGLVALVHRFGCYALARGTEHEREMANVIDLGIDGVSSANVERLVAVATRFYPAREPGSGST